MNRTINSDSISPWYEAFTPNQGHAGWSRPASQIQSDVAIEPTTAEDGWATAAILDYYNS